ncbi:hypothetical protein ACFL96_10710 [Thermoproteota archaeon]
MLYLLYNKNKMERKLVKQGRNALTVTLPAKWLKNKGLEAGDNVYISERSKDLLVSTQLTSAKKEIEMDLQGRDRSVIYHAVQGKYIEGYDKITFIHDNPQVAQEQVKSLLGMIVELHTPTKTVLKSIIAVPEDDFKALMQRAAHILLQQARTLQAMTEGKAKLKDVQNEEELLDFNLLYCLRYLNKYETGKHCYKYFLLCSTMEAGGDGISEVAKFIGTDKQLAEKIVKGIEDYTKCLFTKDLQKTYTALKAFRNKIGTKTFAEGLAYSLAETLYNYIGFLMDIKS